MRQASSLDLRASTRSVLWRGCLTLLLVAKLAAAGEEPAEVTIEIFSDFECPYCKTFAPAAREIERQYRSASGTDTVPLVNAHKRARRQFGELVALRVRPDGTAC